MQTIYPTLPEFNTNRHNSKASPVFRAIYLFPYPARGFFHKITNKLYPAFYRFALRRNTGANTTLVRPFSKIFIWFLWRYFSRNTFYMNLPFQFMPYKRYRDRWVMSQMFTLATSIVSIKINLPSCKSFNNTVRIAGFPSGETVPTNIAVGSFTSASIASCSHFVKGQVDYQEDHSFWDHPLYIPSWLSPNQPSLFFFNS